MVGSQPSDGGPKSKKQKKNTSKHAPFIINTQIQEDDIINAHDVAANTEIHTGTQARLMFEWLIYPLKVSEFYEKYWEQQPLVIQRHCPDYYDGWCNKLDMDEMFKNHTLEYGAEVDLTKYVDNTRYTLNPSGNAKAKDIWKHFEDGCSVRLLCPQKYSDAMWKLLSILEREWGCMAGSNIYLTPANTQGFAPHYDDIEAFLLQTEGTKHWKIYAPLSAETTLPRVSSKNFTQEEIGKPILEVDLKAGDLLYFPRGFIHQAEAVGGHGDYSLHITVSTGQQNTIGNFVELLLPEAIAASISNNINLRKSLPRDYLEYMGVMHSDSQDPRRMEISNSIKNALKTVMGEAMGMLDAASDQMAKNYLLDRLPPALEEEEEAVTSDGSPLLKITINTELKLITHDVARLVVENGYAVVYHCKENSRVHHETPISPLEFELDDAESIEWILQSYPEYFRVGDMPHEDPEDQIGLAEALYKEGILMYRKL